MSRWPADEDELRHGDITFQDEAEEEYYDLSPDDPDYDLSEAAGYAGGEPPGRTFAVPHWLIVVVSLLLVLALVLPAILTLR